jgi:sarcosine oxidase subunit beta
MRAIGTVMRQAQRYFPIMSEVAVIRTIAGFRPASPDSVAIVGDVDGKPGLFVATGHEGDGVALAPITGKLVADMIRGQSYDKSKYDQLNLRRFTNI